MVNADGENHATYDYDFIQSPSAKFLSEKDAILERVNRNGECIDKSHGRRTSLPNSFLVIAKAGNIVILIEVAEIWDTK
jgi:hypothetical protein